MKRDTARQVLVALRLHEKNGLLTVNHGMSICKEFEVSQDEVAALAATLDVEVIPTTEPELPGSFKEVPKPLPEDPKLLNRKVVEQINKASIYKAFGDHVVTNRSMFLRERVAIQKLIQRLKDLGELDQ